MTVLHRVVFAFEILLADLIFLFPCKKRKHFLLRYMIASIALIAVSYFCTFRFNWLHINLAQLIRLLVILGASILGMFFCFQLKLLTVASACAAGYAVEHMTFHITKIIGSTTDLLKDSFWGIPRWELLEYIFFPLIYLLIAATLGVHSAKSNAFKHEDHRLTLPFLAIIASTIGLTRVTNAFGEMASIPVSMYAIACCIMALAVQLILFREINLQHENNTIKLLWQEDRRQYEIMKATIDTINIKHHDLKKHLSAINSMLTKDDIRSIEQAVRIYDCQVKTGNEALDVLLTKNSLICQAEDISLTYAGNGEDFSFMSTMDVYSLFGNAIDNAVEAVRKVSDPEKKIVDISAERIGKMINVIITNYFSGPLCLQDGIPVTSKKEEEGFHGFGIKSMQALAKKYNGSIHINLHDDVFVLTISIFDQR